MGRRAKAKRRATKAAELNSAEANSEIRDEDETDCEVREKLEYLENWNS